MVILNERLIAEQKLTKKDVSAIEELHEAREDMFEIMEELDPYEERELLQLKMYVVLLESLEFNMQRVWKFPQDKHRHTWWNRAPHCICKQTDDSFKMVGFKGRVLNHKCPLHGEEE